MSFVDDGAPIQTRKFSDLAAEKIRRMILSGEFEPGARMNEIALAERLKISRPPIREALRTLSGEGLVRFVAGRGAFVSSLDNRAVTELGEIRLVLEVEAARLAAARATEGDLAHLSSVMQAIEAELRNPGTPYPYQFDFHRAVLDCTGNTRLSQMALEVETQLRLARVTSGNAPERAQEAFAEHQAVFKAICQKNPEAAAAAMGAHIAASTGAISEIVRAAHKKQEATK